MQHVKNSTPGAETIKKALLPGPEDDLDALDELIATGEAVFSLIRLTDLDLDIKGAIFQLEKQFAFWGRLAEANEMVRGDM